MSVARRVFFYLVAIIALGIFSAGVGQLLSLLFSFFISRPSTAIIGRTTFNLEQLSLGLAMLIIGGVLWLLFWRAIQRRVAGNEEETGAVIRKLYLNFILVVSALVAINAASDFLRWLISGADATQFQSESLTALIVPGIIWAYHWRVSEREGHPSPAAETLRRWYVYILAGFGLVWMAIGPVQLINAAVISLPIWPGTLVQAPFWNMSTQVSVTWILLGSLVWYFHWFRMAPGDFDSILRQVYFYLLAILGGAVAALVALTVTLYQIFVFVFGGATSGTHFQFLGWTIPTVVVGAAIWSYHQSIAQEESGQFQERRLSPQRVHIYLMSFLGLGTMVAGVITFFGLIINLAINAAETSLVVTPGWWRGQASLFLALLLVGTPLWLYYWNRVLRRVEGEGITEWRARSRRVYLYLVVGISIVTLAADLVNIVYRLLNGVLQSNFGINVLRNTSWSLQTVVVAAALLWYHWQIIRADQRRGAEVGVKKTVIVLAGGRVEDLALRIDKSLVGADVRVLRAIVPPGQELPTPPDEEIARLISEIQAAPSDKVMLVALEGKIVVMPYQDK